MVFAQNPDSLRRLLAQNRPDTSRVLLLVDLGTAYSFSHSDSSHRFIQQALQLAQRLNFPKGQGRALYALGVDLRLRAELPQALATLFDALAINRASKDQPGETATLNYIGNVYSDLREYRQALSYYKQAKKLAESILDKDRLITELMNIGGTYERMNLLDSALLFNQQAFRLGPTETLVLRNLGILQTRLGNNKLAFGYFRQGLLSTYARNNLRNRGMFEYYLADLFYQIKQPDSSLHYAHLALESFQRASYKSIELPLSNLLTRLYVGKNKLDSAFQYQRLEMALRETLYGPEKLNQLQLFTLAQQRRQQELMADQKEYQNSIRVYALLAGLSVVLILALMLYRNNRQKHKTNILLHGQKEEIDHQRSKAEQALTELKSTQTQLIQREKMASLGELTAGIAHEIQNPLNFVNNFSEVSSELVGELKEEREKGNDRDEGLEEELLIDLEQNLSKITLHGQRASSIVKGMLEHSRTTTGERQPTDLNSLCGEYLRLAYHGFRAKDKDFNTELKTDFDPNLGLVKLVPQEMGQVLLNLYNNAFYAVQQKHKLVLIDYQPTVTVRTSHDNNNIQIRVKDNGVGIPESVRAKVFQPFFTTKPAGEGTGLGLSLSYDIVTKGHRGSLSVESQEGEGTAFTIQLPTTNVSPLA
ncbi:hypothetical protein GCM10027190_63710 [Spirosoma areae]